MQRIFLLALAISFLASLISPLTPTARAQKGQRRIVAAQLFYTPARNTAELARQIMAMRSQGINTIIFRAFGNKGDRIYPLSSPLNTPKNREGVYFATSHAPVIADILGSVADIAHSSGMELFAWMTTRSATYGVNEGFLDREYELETQRERVINKLDLFNPLSVGHLESIFKDLGKYPIDGVLFQDDFLIKHMQGLSPLSRLRYEADFKRLLNPRSMYSELKLKPNGRVMRITYTEEFWRWARWKNKRLREVAKRLIKALRRENPRIKSCFNANYELYTQPKNALAWQSHTTELADEFDLVAVMAYQRQIARELGIELNQARDVVSETAREAIRIHGAGRVIMKLQTADWNDGSPVSNFEIEYFLEGIRRVSEDVGIAFAPWEGGVELNLNRAH